MAGRRGPFWLALLLFIALCWPGQVAAEPGCDPQKALLWSLLPGGGHYYLGETGTGTGYLATILPLLGAGFWLDDRNHSLARHDEANSFFILALKEWELSIFTTYRSAYALNGLAPEQAGIDRAEVGELLAAPFKADNLSDPWVMGAAMIGAVAAALDGCGADRHHRDIERIGVLGTDLNRDWGSLLYGVDAFSLSLGAAVGEEALWRGVLQNELEFRYGRRTGLWSASLLFGVAHVVDLDGELSGERVAVASLAGLYLGHLFQRDRHRLARPIAAHFWYNFAVMLSSFAVDPDNNPLGVTVSFAY